MSGKNGIENSGSGSRKTAQQRRLELLCRLQATKEEEAKRNAKMNQHTKRSQVFSKAMSAESAVEPNTVVSSSTEEEGDEWRRQRRRLQKAIRQVNERQAKMDSLASHAEGWFKKYETLLGHISRDIGTFKAHGQQARQYYELAWARAEQQAARNDERRAFLRQLYGTGGAAANFSSFVSSSLHVGVTTLRAVLYAVARLRDRLFGDARGPKTPSPSPSPPADSAKIHTQ